jgi:zinc protease
MHAYAYRLESRKIGHGAKGYQQSLPSKLNPLGIGLMVLIAVSLIWHSWAGGTEKAPQADTVLRSTLTNGLRVVIVRNDLAPVVTTVMNYLVGSNDAPEGFPGTAHALEHMMFRGSPGLSAGQLANITAAMGGMFNAATQQTVTQYFLTAPKEDLDVALHIEADRMQGVLSTETLWDQERGAIEEEVAQDLSSPEYLAYTRLLRAIFHGTPYAYTPLGTKPSFDKTTGEMLRSFHDKWYTPPNAILVIVGDVEPRDAFAQVKRFFGEIPAGRIPKRLPIRLEHVQPEAFQMKTDQPYGLVIIAFRLPGYGSPDYAAAQILTNVLDSTRNHLHNLVTEGKALDVGFSSHFLPDAGIGYVMAAYSKGADAQTLADEIKRILKTNIRNGFDPNLVEAAKRQEITSAEMRKDSIFHLAMAWSHALAVAGRHSPEEDLKLFHQVSAAEVNQVARKYLDLNESASAVLVPESSGKPSTSGGFRQVESFSLKPKRGIKLPEWAQKALAKFTVPPSHLHPSVVHMPNGLTLIIQTESVSSVVSIFGQIRNKPEITEPAGKEGVSQVLDQMLPYGTKTLDRLAFQKALDDIGAAESVGTTDFSLHVLSEDADRGVFLLADHMLNPALPETAFKIVTQQVASIVDAQLQSPDYLARRALKKMLFPKNDPTLRQATKNSVLALTLADVKEYHRKIFRPDLTTLVVIGDITPARAGQIIEKYFGGWEARGPRPHSDLPPVPANNQATTVSVPNNRRLQDKVILAETIGLTRSNPDYYALELGNHVLGGGFYATRLYQDLREETGLVYYVGSEFNVGKTRGVYLVDYACNPSNVTRAYTIVRQNLKAMQTTPVTAAELQQAKMMLVREIPLAEASTESIARGLLSRDALGLPPDEPTRAAQRYVALTAETVRAAFVKWIRPDDLVQVIEGPTPP